MELTPLQMVLHVTKAFFLSFFSFERYIRICFYCQLRETRVLSDDNVKYYKLFVILFPMLFYIPKCFEVRTGYVVHEKKMRIDCQKYLSLSQLLENPLLKPFIGGQFSEADLVKIEFLAKACNKIIRKLTKQRRFGSIPRQTPISFSCSFFFSNLTKWGKSRGFDVIASMPIWFLRLNFLLSTEFYIVKTCLSWDVVGI